MKPLLAHIYTPHRVSYPCFVQPKLNGIRALYQNGCFQSRDGVPFPPGLLAHLTTPLKKIFSKETILDGELYVHGWPLQRINAAVTPVRLKPTEDTLKVEYHVFDVVDFGKSFIERGRIQQQIAYVRQAGGLVSNVLTGQALDERRANEWYSQFVEDGYEGMMYRLGDCPYTVPKQPTAGWQCEWSRSQFLSDKKNRCWHLLKRKDWQDDEFDFISINETIGEKGERGFQLWCKAKNGTPFKFGTGLSDSEIEHYLEHPPVGRKVKGKYLVLSADGIPLNGTILAIL